MGNSTLANPGICSQQIQDSRAINLLSLGVTGTQKSSIFKTSRSRRITFSLFPLDGGGDSLFSECARKTLDLLLSELDLAKLPAYYAFFRDSFADRTLMAWMADEEEEALMKEAKKKMEIRF